MTTERAAPQPAQRSVDTAAGITLIVSAVLSLIAVLHHPTLEGVHSAAETVQAIRALAGMDKLVHGTLMLIFSAQAIGFYYFSARLGFNRPGAVIGFMAFAMGTVILIIPATLDGFVTPDLSDACAKSADCGIPPVAVTYLIGVAIAAFTKIALVALSLATVFWGATLIRLPDVINRAAGIVGLICGCIPLAVFGLFSIIHLQPNNLAMVILPPVIWTVVAGALMLRHKEA